MSHNLVGVQASDFLRLGKIHGEERLLPLDGRFLISSLSGLFAERLRPTKFATSQRQV